ncbi:DUF3263 domain-containing protein [Streptomyces sp. NPDC020917]|uniref:DUF3263 domain-containing protein n=1 Tax=Streptomyces sp. NPDC020917 TaxID=3365102 RepID=UPI0037902600
MNGTGDATSGPHGDGGGPGELSERDRAVLDIAGRTWPGPGPRERAIRERLDISPTAYFQLLNALLDDPRALAHAPVTVNRLRAERERHRAGR